MFRTQPTDWFLPVPTLSDYQNLEISRNTSQAGAWTDVDCCVRYESSEYDTRRVLLCVLVIFLTRTRTDHATFLNRNSLLTKGASQNTNRFVVYGIFFSHGIFLRLYTNLWKAMSFLIRLVSAKHQHEVASVVFFTLIFPSTYWNEATLRATGMWGSCAAHASVTSWYIISVLL